MGSYTQKEVEERAQIILSMPVTFRSGVINEFHRFSKGIDDDGIMDEYYPGKPNKFFADVLALVEASG